MSGFTTLGAVALFWLSLTMQTLAQQIADGQIAVVSNLRAGAAKADVTPAIVPGLKTTGHVRPVDGVRDPLHVGVLLLDDGETRAAIVTSDFVDAGDLWVSVAREAVATGAEVPKANVMVTASHNHSALKLEDHPNWLTNVSTKIGSAAREAAANMRTVSIGYGVDAIQFGINRRKTIDGRAVVNLNPQGPNDPRVKVLRFDDGNSLTPVAILMHAVCHPCFFTWGDKGTHPYPNGYPKISADFPGEAQRFVEMCYAQKTCALFVQGCAGDIRPNLPGYPYRCADEADIQWAGRDLGGAVIRSCAYAAIREQVRQRESYYPIRVASRIVDLPGKKGSVQAELMAMKIGPFLFLTMPGEPMVEFGFKLETAIADRAIPFVLGYANGSIGYIATADSHLVGGYEPNKCPLTPEAEKVLLGNLGQLADQVIGDVFESFSKHPKDLLKREAEARERLEISNPKPSKTDR